MKDLVKATGLEGPFRTAASVVLSLGIASVILKVVQALQRSDASNMNMLAVLASILDILLDMSVALLSALFFLVAVQYLAHRRSQNNL